MSGPALVFIPARAEGPEFLRWLALCLAAIEAAGVELLAVVRRWPDVDRMLETGEADQVIVARLDHVPDRRIVVAGELTAGDRADGPRQGRPRPVSEVRRLPDRMAPTTDRGLAGRDRRPRIAG
ncbi:hypothetical protein [Asanoa iriomotensis]|uniref:Uncharacterized protein n=1 Tax=Asanoa iriomotensis TaxID=234613 RepID=A0ABQ4CES8_9ACTN|nr:hypothetical protein [Asanoa iriomotensis]GIF61276.1 hypothetical protein Air01nite_73710 [Asanoa iriomotensis]